jgi:hypothetical protein
MQLPENPITLRGQCDPVRAEYEAQLVSKRDQVLQFPTGSK